MAKRTAVIDIGSNSARMVIFERTSRFAFHLIHEVKSRVRISENAYENDHNLQEIPLERAYQALKEFLLIIKQYKVRKTLCICHFCTQRCSQQTNIYQQSPLRAWSAY